MSQHVEVELPMYTPEALPVPTERVRWWVLLPESRATGRVAGDLADVVGFVRAHWGDEEIDASGSVEEWLRFNRV